MPMYFVQHGMAVAKEVDPDRPLSAEGRREVEQVGRCLRHMELTLRGIYHSGKTRARQTAEILSAEVGLDYASELDGMKPNDDVVMFAKAVADDSMYVGHLPHLDKLVSHLVADDENAGVVSYSNGGVVCVGKDEAGYHVAWYLTPAACKRN